MTQSTTQILMKHCVEFEGLRSSSAFAVVNIAVNGPVLSWKYCYFLLVEVILPQFV